MSGLLRSRQGLPSSNYSLLMWVYFFLAQLPLFGVGFYSGNQRQFMNSFRIVPNLDPDIRKDGTTMIVFPYESGSVSSVDLPAAALSAFSLSVTIRKPLHFTCLAGVCTRRKFRWRYFAVDISRLIFRGWYFAVNGLDISRFKWEAKLRTLNIDWICRSQSITIGCSSKRSEVLFLFLHASLVREGVIMISFSFCV